MTPSMQFLPLTTARCGLWTPKQDLLCLASLSSLKATHLSQHPQVLSWAQRRRYAQFENAVFVFVCFFLSFTAHIFFKKKNLKFAFCVFCSLNLSDCYCKRWRITVHHKFFGQVVQLVASARQCRLSGLVWNSEVLKPALWKCYFAILFIDLLIYWFYLFLLKTKGPDRRRQPGRPARLLGCVQQRQINTFADKPAQNMARALVKPPGRGVIGWGRCRCEIDGRACTYKLRNN